MTPRFVPISRTDMHREFNGVAAHMRGENMRKQQVTNPVDASRCER
jgi:hypothetical protein